MTDSGFGTTFGVRAGKCTRIACACAMLILSTGTRFAEAQVQQIGSMVGVPDEILELRAAQTQLAMDAGISLRIKDEHGRSSTMIVDGVPAEMRDVVIATEHDLIGLLDSLYAYYGFTGTETLEFERRGQIMDDMSYLFREYIDGIETSVLFDVLVDLDTRRINRFRGWLELDREFERTPRLAEREAIAVAVCVVQASELFTAENFGLGGPHETEVVYEPWGGDGALNPVWRVRLAPPAGRLGMITESFTIGPDGVLRRSERSSHGPEFTMPEACLRG